MASVNKDGQTDSQYPTEVECENSYTRKSRVIEDEQQKSQEEIQNCHDYETTLIDNSDIFRSVLNVHKPEPTLNSLNANDDEELLDIC